MRHVIPAVCLGILLCSACDGGTGPDPRDSVALVTISPGEATLAVGSTRALTAIVKTAGGTLLTGREVSWRSSDSLVARVSPAGVVTARTSGAARIIATSEGRSGEAQITVAPPEVARVDLSHVAATLEEGQELQLIATPRDAQGNPIEGLGTQWSSSAPAIASVGSLGKVTAIRPGTAEVRVKVQGKEASLTVTVGAGYGFDLIYTMGGGSAPGWEQIFRLDVRRAGATPERLMPAEPWASTPAPSPDGSRIAFVCLDTFGGHSLCVSNRDGSDRRLIAFGLGESHGEPAWSPDGTRVAYVRTSSGSGTPVSRIWVADRDGSDPVALTADMAGRQRSPAWSSAGADGTERIAFVQNATGNSSDLRIWTMRPDGTDKGQIGTSAGTMDDQPAWSPDGETIAFVRTSATIGGDLWLMDAEGGNERPLTGALAGMQSAPAWSPDGRLVAFISSHETYGSDASSFQIYTVWADGSKLARRTFDAGDKSAPAWLLR